jgi:hypothetical protein
MSHMSRAQIRLLALWSLGIVIAKSCGLSQVTAYLAEALHDREANLRQRLREWYWEKQAKRGRVPGSNKALRI